MHVLCATSVKPICNLQQIWAKHWAKIAHWGSKDVLWLKPYKLVYKSQNETKRAHKSPAVQRLNENRRGLMKLKFCFKKRLKRAVWGSKGSKLWVQRARRRR